jgi:hypothetical protein
LLVNEISAIDHIDILNVAVGQNVQSVKIAVGENAVGQNCRR